MSMEETVLGLLDTRKACHAKMAGRSAAHVNSLLNAPGIFRGCITWAGASAAILRGALPRVRAGPFLPSTSLSLSNLLPLIPVVQRVLSLGYNLSFVSVLNVDTAPVDPFLSFLRITFPSLVSNPSCADSGSSETAQLPIHSSNWDRSIALLCQLANMQSECL